LCKVPAISLQIPISTILTKAVSENGWVSAQAFATWFFTDSFELLAKWLDLGNLMLSAQLSKPPSLLSASNFASHKLKLLKFFAAPLLKWFTAALLEKTIKLFASSPKKPP
jgi:hypothetical protein